MDDTSSTDTPDLIASTGINDSSSPWNGFLQTALSSGLQIGTNALNAQLASQTPITGNNASNGAPIVVTAPAAAPSSSSSKSSLWIIGAVVLVVLGFFLINRK